MIVDFPAPVDPTIAIVSPALTSKEIPCNTSSSSIYPKWTSVNLIVPCILAFSIVPSLGILLSVSKILKTLFAATIPICSVLNLSAMWRKGLKSIPEKSMNVKISPYSPAAMPVTFCKPPNHTIKPMLTAPSSSATAKNIELYQTVRNQAFWCFSFISLNFSFSISSLLNNCTIFIPAIRSCTKEFKLET